MRQLSRGYWYGICNSRDCSEPLYSELNGPGEVCCDAVTTADALPRLWSHRANLPVQEHILTHRPTSQGKLLIFLSKREAYTATRQHLLFFLSYAGLSRAAELGRDGAANGTRWRE